MPSGRDIPAGIQSALESRAIELALNLSVDGALTETIHQLSEAEAGGASPWLLCYQAMERRLSQGDYAGTLKLAQEAAARFERLGDRDGYARALAETAIARYHFGQYALALAEIAACPPPQQPACVAALALAAYVNHVGINTLPDAIRAAEWGLHALEAELGTLQSTAWRIVLQRNLAAAYHFQGELAAARRAAEDAVQLAETHHANSYLYDWALYEYGLLEQRAGRLDLALEILRRARARLEHSAVRAPIWRWVLAAEGQALRDLALLKEADECYQRGGWGEGDDGPLMLWLLQGRHSEARMATEARLAAAHASAAPFEVANLTVLLALLELEEGATPLLRDTLRAAADQYATLGFLYHHASALCHLAAVEYALDNAPAGDQALAEALGFGAARGYLNFAWWHPARMRALLRHALSAGIEPEYAGRLLHERGLDQPSGMVVLALRCLGDFEVRLDGEPLPRSHWQGHSAGAVRMQRLLLYLARHREPRSIDAIARYVWPDVRDQIDVAHNFHLTLAGLRRVLEPDLHQGGASRFVATTPQGYQLLPGIHATVDLDQFQAELRGGHIAAATGGQDAAREAFTRAEQLYSGDFALAKPDPGEAEEYRRALQEALRWLAEDDLRRGAHDSCIARARRLLRDDPWDTAAPALLIEAYLARGDRRSARRQYERYLKQHGEASPEIAQIARKHRL
ncbi:MAG: BTAD domain-containing putative transcriptional regulator [Roseiflexaceae bacterium]